MKTMFNEFGVPNKEVNEAAEKVENIVRQLLRQMADAQREGEGYLVSELRAVGGVFVQAVDCCVAEAVLDAAYNIRQAARRNADPNLCAEEIILSRAGNKIMAIKHYRERTTFGLKESKDAVEAWMLENLGTKNPAYVPVENVIKTEESDEARNES